MADTIIKELIWTYKGVDYTAKALSDNDWKKLVNITRAKLLNDCKDIDDPEYRRARAEEIQSSDYSRFEIIRKLGRADIRAEFTYLIFKDNKGMTKELCDSFWLDEGFENAGGFVDSVLEASGIPIKELRGLIEEKPDENPTQPES